MKRFAQNEIREAYAHAAAGGQALHVCNSRQFVTISAPNCFRRSSLFAHLIDNDWDRLVRTARRLGVRVVVVERAGVEGLHVDLCGRPLVRALELAAAAEMPELRLMPVTEPSEELKTFVNERLGEPWK